MGPEPLEWLHVSLINTATALDTVCLINIQATRERRAGWGGLNGETGGKFMRNKTGRSESLRSS